jgi:hypothetical protein
MEHISCDGQPVEVGKKFWNNDLRVCEVISIGDWSNDYADTGCKQTWHKTSHGSFDTLDGSMQPYGRLTRRFQGKDAEDYEPGTNYSDIKKR